MALPLFRILCDPHPRCTEKVWGGNPPIFVEKLAREPNSNFIFADFVCIIFWKITQGNPPLHKKGDVPVEDGTLKQGRAIPQKAPFLQNALQIFVVVELGVQDHLSLRCVFCILLRAFVF